MSDRFCRGCGRKLASGYNGARKGWCSGNCRLRHKFRSMPHRNVLEEPVSLPDLAHWLRVQSDEEFDRIWVYAVIETMSHDGQIALGALTRVLHEVRKRYTKIHSQASPAAVDAMLGRKIRLGKAKVNEMQVRVIRKIENMTTREIGRVFGISAGAVSCIRLRQTWQNLP